MYGWTSSEKTGPHGEYCKCSYAGVVPTKAAVVVFWMVEAMLHVIRWENMFVGPLVTLTSGSEADLLEKSCVLASWVCKANCVASATLESDGSLPLIDV